MANPFQPWQREAFNSKTLHLSRMQKAAYKNLLEVCFAVGGELPDDDKKLALICEIDVRTFRKHRALLLGFFYRTADGWRHQRVDEDLARISRQREKRAIAGQRGGLQTAIRWHRKH